MNNEKILTHVDLHMHSSFSDGSDSPQEIIDKLRAREIHTFALTDHDTMAGCDEMAKLVPEDMTFFRGIEFSCRSEAGTCLPTGPCTMRWPRESAFGIKSSMSA